MADKQADLARPAIGQLDTHPIDAQVVHAPAEQKRVALSQFGMEVGEGLCTDMHARRKGYFLDHHRRAYVDQSNWQKLITPERP